MSVIPKWDLPVCISVWELFHLMLSPWGVREKHGGHLAASGGEGEQGT